MKILVAIIAIALAQTAATSAERPMAGEVVENTGRSWSMGRTFPPGAKARIFPATPDADLVGLVIVGKKTDAGGRRVAHRCVAQGRAVNGGMWYVTMGDGNLVLDPIRWSYADIYGVLDLPRKEFAK